MEFTTEKISGNKVKLSFTVPAAAFDEAMQKAYLKVRGKVNVPGFRKGKAPRKLIETMYGESIFYDDAFDVVFPDAYAQAVEKEGLQPVDRPEIDLEEIGAGKDLKFTAEVFVRPDVTLGDYKKLKATKHLHDLSDEEIEHRISHDVEKATTSMEVTDRAAQMEDTVTLDYAGTVNGVAFDGGTAQGQTLVLGSNSFIPGFEDQVVGMSIGEEKDLKVTFPAEYHAQELAGKDAVFHVKVHGISAKLKPELDDEFAADVSEHTTFKAYREAIVKELTELRDKNAETTLENELIQQATDQADCDIPDAMVEDEISAQVRNTQMRMAYQGIRYEDYLKYTGMTEEQVRDMFRADSQNNIKMQLVLEAIAKKEGLEPNDDQVDTEIARHAKEMGREVEDYKPTINERQMGYYKDLAQSRLVIDLLKANADITVHEGPAHEDEPIDVNEIVQQVADALPEEEAEAPKKKAPARKPAAKKEETAEKPKKAPAKKETKEEAAEKPKKAPVKKIAKKEGPKEG